MDESALFFYRRQSGSANNPAATKPSAEMESASPSPGLTKPVAKYSGRICPHAVVTGCQRTFRGKSCCYAVQDHLCNPPKSLLPSFISTEDKQPITLAQVYIANGCHL